MRWKGSVWKQLLLMIMNKIMSADKIIFPGVGEASSAMKYLKDHRLDDLIKNLKQPVLEFAWVCN